MICQTFAIRRFVQSDGVLRVLERDELPEGCPPWCRVFTVEEVPRHKDRGDHAHRRTHQVFVMLRGSCVLTVETPDGRSHTQELTGLRSAAVWVPPWRWCVLREWSERALLLVLASHPYDPAEYIEDRATFAAGVEVGP